MTELKTCPFCGSDAELDEQGLNSNGRSVWTFINCKHRCSVNPMASGCVDIGYYLQDSWDFVKTRTVEEAQAKATERATDLWNERH